METATIGLVLSGGGSNRKQQGFQKRNQNPLILKTEHVI